MALPRFRDVSTGLIIDSGRGLVDERMNVEGAINSFRGGRSLLLDENPVVMGHTAAEQLFAMVGLDAKVVDALDGHPGVQRAMLQAKMRDVEPDNRSGIVVARGRDVEGERFVDSLITREYLPALNSTILSVLEQSLPDDAQVHSSYINNRSLSLRIVSPGWTHDLGGGDTAYSGIVIRNDELGRTGFMVRAAVARVACFNWSLLDSPIFEHTSGVLPFDNMVEGLTSAIGNLDELADGVAHTMRQFHDVEVEDVASMLRVLVGEQGLPGYVEEAALQYWRDTGANQSLFWVHQAMAFAVQRITDRNAKNKIGQWNRRDRAEVRSYGAANSFLERGTIEICTCPRCHRPMREYDIDGDFVEISHVEHTES